MREKLQKFTIQKIQPEPQKKAQLPIFSNEDDSEHHFWACKSLKLDRTIKPPIQLMQLLLRITAFKLEHKSYDPIACS